MPLADDQAARDAIPHSDPLGLFDSWLAEARGSELNDPNAMALATATPQGAPSVRMVLLKGHGADGFVFYTNAQSRKGGEIASNPQAALLFHWKSLRRQIRIEGPLEEVSASEADAYFHSRGRESQLARNLPRPGGGAAPPASGRGAAPDALDRLPPETCAHGVLAGPA
jgi:pyridoxamine 5'-phosphate oxidase